MSVQRGNREGEIKQGDRREDEWGQDDNAGHVNTHRNNNQSSFGAGNNMGTHWQWPHGVDTDEPNRGGNTGEGTNWQQQI